MILIWYFIFYIYLNLLYIIYNYIYNIKKCDCVKSMIDDIIDDLWP